MKQNIIPNIISQHAEEAAFLWLLRDAAATASNYNLNDLAKLDERIEAHLDGLRIAGEAGWEICTETLTLEEPGEIFTAAVLALESNIEDRLQIIYNKVSDVQELLRGLISALGWLPFQQAEPHIFKLLNFQATGLIQAATGACAAHRYDPGHGLDKACFHDDPFIKARGLKAAGELRRDDMLPIIKKSLGHENKYCRLSAAWSAALLGDAEAVSILCDLAEQGAPGSEMACAMALRRMDLSAAQSWQHQLYRQPKTEKLAVTAAGIIGDPISVPWLIQQMDIPVLARVAGESLAMITGVDIVDEGLEGEGPENFEAGPTENSVDEEVEMDPDEDLAWPASHLIIDWWEKNKRLFQSGTRYLLGQPITNENLQHVIRRGFQRQRAAAALDLAILQPNQPLFEVRAPGFRQYQILG